MASPNTKWSSNRMLLEGISDTEKLTFKNMKNGAF